MKRIDVSIKKNIDFSPAHVINNLFFSLHILLVKQADSSGLVNIGIGFPEYDLTTPTLGDVISLFGNQDSLSDLDLPQSIPDMRDYVLISAPMDVAAASSFFSFKKVKPMDSPENKIRRAMKRHGYSRQEAEKKYQEYHLKNRYSKVQYSKTGKREKGFFPYIKFFSCSTKQTCSFFIVKEDADRRAESFNSFGLQASRKLLDQGIDKNNIVGGVPA